MSGKKRCPQCHRPKNRAIQEQVARGECCSLPGCVFQQEIRQALSGAGIRIRTRPGPEIDIRPRPDPIGETIRIGPVIRTGRTTPDWLTLRNVLIAVGSLIVLIIWLANRLPVPQNLRHEALGADSVTVRWDNAGDGLSYQVYISKQNAPSSAITIGEQKATTSINVINMDSNTSYYFWVTSIDGERESRKSSVHQVRTASPIYGISLSQRSPYTFSSTTVGYGQQSAHTVTVRNTGNHATGSLTIGLSGANANRFTLSETSLESISASGSKTFTIRPNNGLAAGSYNATAIVSGSNITSQSFNVSFSVTIATTSTASQPSLIGTTWNRTDNTGRQFTMSFPRGDVVAILIRNRDGSLERDEGRFILRGDVLTLNFGGHTESYTYSPQRIVNRSNQFIVFTR